MKSISSSRQFPPPITSRKYEKTRKVSGFHKFQTLKKHFTSTDENPPPFPRRDSRPSAHPATLASRNNLGGTFLMEGKFPEAEAEYRALNDLFERAFGPDHWYVYRSYRETSKALRAQRKYKESSAFLDSAAGVLNRGYSDCGSGFVSPRSREALNLASEGGYAEAEALLRAVRNLMLRTEDPEGFDTAYAHGRLAEILRDQGKDEEARPEAEAAYAGFRKCQEEEHPATVHARKLVEELKAEE